MPLTTEDSFKIAKEIQTNLINLSKQNFGSFVSKKDLESNPIIDVNAEINNEYGSFNLYYTFPLNSELHKQGISEIKKELPNTNRIMIFCQGLFDTSAKYIQKNCTCANEDGKDVFNYLSVNSKFKVSKYKNEIGDIIESSIAKVNKEWI